MSPLVGGPTARQRRLWELTRMRRQIDAEITAIEAQIEAEQLALGRALSARGPWAEESGLVAFLDDITITLGTTLTAIRSDQRRATVSRARHIAAAAAHEAGWNLSAIGRALNRNHSTIYNSVKVCRAKPELRATVEALLAPRQAAS